MVYLLRDDTRLRRAVTLVESRDRYPLMETIGGRLHVVCNLQVVIIVSKATTMLKKIMKNGRTERKQKWGLEETKLIYLTDRIFDFWESLK